jgi:3-oxoacyl-[acyl-carrier-protein] synthase III
MTEETKLELMSRRRVFSVLGLTAALGFAVPATVLTVSDAEAQTSGMERRGERRAGRHERRVKRGAQGATNGVTRGAEAAQRPLAPAPLAQSSSHVV